MRDPHDRDAFLGAVRSRLDLPDAMAREVLEELAGHLDDAGSDLRAAGLSSEDAEQRALGRLGDPEALGADLARARRGRRRALAAVGGGVRAVIVEGIRAWIFLALGFGLATILAMPAASLVLHALGRSTSSYFGGPLGSLVTVAAVAGGFAYLGWIVPARVARPAVRSVRGVRLPVALFGLTVGSAILWLLVSVAMDPVLAVGLPFGPVAFALAALRAPERPTFRVGFVPALIGAAVLFLPMTLLALATTTESNLGGWMADTGAIGAVPSATDVESTVRVEWDVPFDALVNTVSVDAGDSAQAVAGRLPTLRVEVWPAQVIDGVMRFGRSPLVSVDGATQPVTRLNYSLPRLREPMTTVAFLVGIDYDGRRVVLGEDLNLAETPPWTGTLAGWWTGN